MGDSFFLKLEFIRSVLHVNVDRVIVSTSAMMTTAKRVLGPPSFPSLVCSTCGPFTTTSGNCCLSLQSPLPPKPDPSERLVPIRQLSVCAAAENGIGKVDRRSRSAHGSERRRRNLQSVTNLTKHNSLHPSQAAPAFHAVSEINTAVAGARRKHQSTLAVYECIFRVF